MVAKAAKRLLVAGAERDRGRSRRRNKANGGASQILTRFATTVVAAVCVLDVFVGQETTRLFLPNDSGPRVARNSPEPPPEPAKDYARKQFWGYGEAAPRVRRSRVHFLSSFPGNLRLTLDTGDAETNLTGAFDRYASDPDNVFPQKHHLAEFNPSIARLPRKYLANDEWLRTFGAGRGAPLYVATYRISNWSFCYLGSDEQMDRIRFNYNYASWRGTKPTTEFIGFALLNRDLDIVADTILDFGTTGVFQKRFQDYRVFNLRGGDGENEQLYVTTDVMVVPIELVSSQESNNKTAAIDGYTKLLPPPMFGPNSGSNDRQQQQQQQQQEPKFVVWHRNKASCLPLKRGKNFLYFDEATAAAASNDTASSSSSSTTTTTTALQTKAVVWPRGNPMSVLSVDLNEACTWATKPEPSYLLEEKKRRPPQPKPSFRTREEEIYPGADRYVPDRGSGCCVRVPRDPIPVSPSMADHASKTASNTLLVAIVHTRTKKGADPKVYLSRFIAFLPRAPYTIVARSGLFCLGFFAEDETKTTSNSPEYRAFRESSVLRLGNETVDGCPAIHFTMSIIEKHDEETNEQHHQQGASSTNNNEEGAVIISYGIGDCYSRFVEVKKSDIISMFRGNNTNSY